MAVGRQLLGRAAIDWTAEGYPPDTLDELIELMLRLLESMVTDPRTPARTGDGLRRYLRRWLSVGPD